MTTLEAQLIERLKKLPANRVAEVVDFVEFLAEREERAAAKRRLDEGLTRLDALNLPSISEDEVADEVHAAGRIARSAVARKVLRPARAGAADPGRPCR